MSKIGSVLKLARQGGKYLIKGAVKHAPVLLSSVGTAGVIGAVILAAKKAPDAKVELDEVKEEWEATEEKEKRVKADYIFKRIRVGAKHYWIVALVAGGAITCFWLANHISFKRLVSALTAAGLSTKAKEELEEKIKELDGEKHLQKIKEEIDADRIKNDPPVESKIIDTGLGMHLCYEPITGRYFYSNIERVKKAVIMCRDYLQKDGYLALNDWFNELNLDTTDCGSYLCWTANNIDEVNDFDITFSSQLTPDGAPVLVIQYECIPTMERRDY